MSYFTKKNLTNQRLGDDRDYLNGKEDIHEKVQEITTDNDEVEGIVDKVKDKAAAAKDKVKSAAGAVKDKMKGAAESVYDAVTGDAGNEDE